jgi:hypothetical protein
VTRTCPHEDGYQALVDTGGEVGAARSGRFPGSRSPPISPAQVRATTGADAVEPLFIDVRAGAVSGLGDLLSDRRISSEGTWRSRSARPGRAADGGVEPAVQCRRLHRARRQPRGGRQAQVTEACGKNYDALVGIGRRTSTSRVPAARLALPMVAVAIT